MAETLLSTALILLLLSMTLSIKRAINVLENGDENDADFYAKESNSAIYDFSTLMALDFSSPEES